MKNNAEYKISNLIWGNLTVRPWLRLGLGLLFGYALVLSVYSFLVILYGSEYERKMHFGGGTPTWNFFGVQTQVN